MTEKRRGLEVRPYQLMHIILRLGEGRGDDLGDARLNEILRAVRADPAVPLTLRCNVTSTYEYQNPGTAEDTPEGALFNVRRDLKIMQRMGMTPGATHPATQVFKRLLEAVDTAKDILWFEEATSRAWRGEPRENCRYEEGRALGLEAVIPGRSEQEMARVKVESVKAMYAAERLDIRPHHLMCMACFYGDREELAPIPADNLFEAIDIIHRNPEIPIRLMCGPCMICPPCAGYLPATGDCIAGVAMSLRDELKDLDVLQRLGLEYGDTLPASKMYRGLFDCIASTTEICGYGDGVARSPEWHVCRGPEGSAGYKRARAEGLGFLNPPSEPCTTGL